MNGFLKKNRPTDEPAKSASEPIGHAATALSLTLERARMWSALSFAFHLATPFREYPASRQPPFYWAHRARP